MKKLKVLAMMLCIAAMGLTTSCSKDNEDLIVGKWKCTASTTTITNLTTNEVTTRNDPSVVGMIIEFTKDGKMIFDGQTVSYTVNGSELTEIFDNGEQNKFDINELTENKLKFSSKPVEEQGKRYVSTAEFVKM
jgi:hypothetical protein